MKFGEKENLERMQKDGILYCNTITYFANLEDEKRGDFFESVRKLQYTEKGLFQVKPANDPSAEWKSLNSFNVLFKEFFKEPLGNLFCMSAFKIKPQNEISTFNINEKFFDFKYCLLILRQDIFMERLRHALDNLEFKTHMDLVEYTDLHKYSGTKTLFQKDNKYNWQEEFRIVFYTNKYEMKDPYEFSIGNIEDISEIYELTKTNSFEYKL
jgi:hypothetical protein